MISAGPIRRIGRQRTPTFQCYVDMIKRCCNPKCRAFPDYGARGIVVCPEWRRSFERFYADMGERPPGHSLERKDNDGPYSPENCRWATRVEQQNNTRRNRWITIAGRTDTFTNWARRNGLKKGTVKFRITELGWSIERALTTPAAPVYRQY